MIDNGKRSILGVEVDVIDYEGAVAKIIRAAHKKEACTVSALAVHGVMTGALNARHKYRLNRFNIVTPDGQPVRWALRYIYGEKLKDRVYGPTLTLKICEKAAEIGLSVFLFGSRLEVLEKMAFRLKELYPALRIVGMEPSAFRTGSVQESEALAKRITASGADIVFVGLGCPRQEIFSFENANYLSRPTIAVGAAFDFHAGLLAQAPPWMQQIGLEWLFRLIKEPGRLWRRYVYLNPLYCMLLVAQMLRVENYLIPREKQPEAEVNYL